MCSAKYYAVRVGRTTGIFRDWESCRDQVHGYPNAQYKSFRSSAEAEAFVSATDSILGKRPRDSVEENTSKRPCRETDATVVYTDGSCLSNGQAGALGGVGVWFGADDPRNVSEPLDGVRQTNQRAEIMAVKRALERASDERLEIRTDSQYVIKAFTEWIKRWRVKKFCGVTNADLFQEVDGMLRGRTKAVDFVYVAAHTGEPGNEAADALARSGAARTV